MYGEIQQTSYTYRLPHKDNCENGNINKNVANHDDSNDVK